MALDHKENIELLWTMVRTGSRMPLTDMIKQAEHNSDIVSSINPTLDRNTRQSREAELALLYAWRDLIQLTQIRRQLEG